MPTLRIAISQLNPVVGDLRGNARRIVACALRARDELHADLVVFPELALSGYPPEDLLLREGFLRYAEESLATVLAAVTGIDVILGAPTREQEAVYNSALLLRDGQVAARYHKQLLPNYGVFDEKRYFAPGSQPCVVDVKGVRVGLSVCEDIWQPLPARLAREAGAELIVNINASPYHVGKGPVREETLRVRVQETGLPILYVNQVGGQDELVFDGESLAVQADGTLALRAPAFEESLLAIGYENGRWLPGPQALREPCTEEASVYQALVLGIRDYVGKNGFKGAVLGLSGGIDSALTLALAVDALGAAQVEAVTMPSRYTARMSVEDALAEAAALGVHCREIGIEPVFEAFLASLKASFEGRPADITEENLQARCRGVILMAISNKTGRMLLTTGNKSEMAVGYATLYGDMAGGFAPLKDIYKQWVYRLSRYRNSISPVIPERVLTRPPTAELRADQKDSDSLPPYEVLDAILELFIEEDLSVTDIVARGYDAATVHRVARLVLGAEYKRRQSPPGVRITRRAFGKDRRYPITSGYGRD